VGNGSKKRIGCVSAKKLISWASLAVAIPWFATRQWKDPVRVTRGHGVKRKCQKESNAMSEVPPLPGPHTKSFATGGSSESPRINMPALREGFMRAKENLRAVKPGRSILLLGGGGPIR